MDDLESHVAAHYAPGHLMHAIHEALTRAGADPAALRPEDLKPVDEFHVGGLEATAELLDPLGIDADTRVLDLGSGIGGTARFLASRHGATVTGIDLTPEFVEAARALSRSVGLDDRVTFNLGSVLDMPFAADQFDLATMLHVGMNIADKSALFAEVFRVLAPGGRFALYDIMTGTDAAAIDFPVPWSSTPAESFVVAPDIYRGVAEAAGFELVAERDRSAFATDFFQRVAAQTAANGVPPVGLHLLMGEAAAERYGNAAKATIDGRLSPWEMVFRKPG